MKKITIKKGRNLNLRGAPLPRIDKAPAPTRVGVLPQEFPGIKPKLSVKEGDRVKKKLDIPKNQIYENERGRNEKGQS